MGNLFSTLLSSADSLRVFEQALSVVQSNVANATTPGYAKQRLALNALPLQPEAGVAGGVAAGDVENLRNAYAEQAVWRQQGLFGRASQRSSDLSRTEGLFPVTEGAGIPAALSKFFQSFATLSVAPNNAVPRQAVIESAEDVASAFRNAAAGLSTASNDAARQIGETLDRINHLGEEIRRINSERRWNGSQTIDAGLDARFNATLEELSELIEVTPLPQSDGSVMLIVGGQAPLVIGDTLRPVSADLSGPTTVIQDSDGNDITGTVQIGRLAALVDLRDRTLPGYSSELNRLAGEFAGRVNDQLRQGLDQYGQSPSKDLFEYDPELGAGALSVAPMQPEDLAAADAGAPGGNGNALAVAAMAGSKQIDNFTFAGYYGRLAAQVGRDVSGAKDDEATEEQLLSQARTLRNDISGVSLDEEAIYLLQFQRSYEASARLVTVLNSLTDTLLNLIH